MKAFIASHPDDLGPKFYLVLAPDSYTAERKAVERVGLQGGKYPDIKVTHMGDLENATAEAFAIRLGVDDQAPRPRALLELLDLAALM
jgi:hypothetical protein